MKTQKMAIVEDDYDDQYLLKIASEKLERNLELDVYYSGNEFYDSLKVQIELKQAIPDIILLDLNLPGWDGKKTLRRLRALSELKMVPIIIYTTSRSEKDMEEAYSLGASSYIVKAMSFEKIERNMQLICDYWLGLVGVQGRGK